MRAGSVGYCGPADVLTLCSSHAGSPISVNKPHKRYVCIQHSKKQKPGMTGLLNELIET
jgi:hypothetical protein